MKPRRGNLGRIADLAVLERELGKVEYAIHQAKEPAEREALLERKEGLLALLDAENARPAGPRSGQQDP